MFRHQCTNQCFGHPWSSVTLRRNLFIGPYLSYSLIRTAIRNYMAFCLNKPLRTRSLNDMQCCMGTLWVTYHSVWHFAMYTCISYDGVVRWSDPDGQMDNLLRRLDGFRLLTDHQSGESLSIRQGRGSSSRSTSCHSSIFMCFAEPIVLGHPCFPLIRRPVPVHIPSGSDPTVPRNGPRSWPLISCCCGVLRSAAALRVPFARLNQRT